MMMTDQDLDALFAAARAEPPEPSDALLARIVADAVAEMAAPAVAAQSTPGFWASLSAAIGGWPAISGLAAATVAGVWIGFAPPTAVDTLATSVWGEAAEIAVFSSDDILGIEG